MEIDSLELEHKIELPQTGTYLFESDIHYLRHSLGFDEWKYPECQDKFETYRNRYCAKYPSPAYNIMENLVKRGLAGRSSTERDYPYYFYYITETGIKALSEYLNTEIIEKQ